VQWGDTRATACQNEGWSMVTLPFGKHKGERIDTLPTAYLRWFVGNVDGLDAWLEQQIRAELQDRGERYLRAVEVFSELEEGVLERLTEADGIDHATAGIIGDVLLDAFQDLRRRYGIGRETELVVNEGKPGA
jgi:hypothetical protein